MVNIQEQFELYIDGQWVKPETGKYLETKSPATGKLVSKFAQAGKADIDKAVKAARDAFEGGWKDTSTEKRAVLLNKIADIIDENKERLATIESMDNGKPIRETLNVDVPQAADHFRYFASVIRSEEDQVKTLDGHLLSLVIKEPIGVV